MSTATSGRAMRYARLGISFLIGVHLSSVANNRLHLQDLKWHNSRLLELVDAHRADQRGMQSALEAHQHALEAGGGKGNEEVLSELQRIRGGLAREQAQSEARREWIEAEAQRRAGPRAWLDKGRALLGLQVVAGVGEEAPR